MLLEIKVKSNDLVHSQALFESSRDRSAFSESLKVLPNVTLHDWLGNGNRAPEWCCLSSMDTIVKIVVIVCLFLIPLYSVGNPCLSLSVIIAHYQIYIQEQLPSSFPLSFRLQISVGSHQGIVYTEIVFSFLKAFSCSTFSFSLSLAAKLLISATAFLLLKLCGTRYQEV